MAGGLTPLPGLDAEMSTYFRRANSYCPTDAFGLDVDRQRAACLCRPLRWDRDRRSGRLSFHHVF